LSVKTLHHERRSKNPFPFAFVLSLRWDFGGTQPVLSEQGSNAVLLNLTL
jgi:hypothetical protein